MNELFATRRSGVLLHVSSLPSAYGIGDMGSGLVRFLDFLEASGLTLWQILPLTPVSSFLGNSPYSSNSLFAGNTLFISPERLAADGYLRLSELSDFALPNTGKVDYPRCEVLRQSLLDRVYLRWGRELLADSAFQAFVQRHASAWLDDFALFCALKKKHGGQQWTRWAAPYRQRDAAALSAFAEEERDTIQQVLFEQYLFFSQWERVREECRRRGILLIGDAPFYPTHDSADVWAHQELFQLDERGESRQLAGVPPDYFSETGQLWGNPVYAWPAHAAEDYAWCLHRMEHSLREVDILRIDHFRALAGYWAVPHGEKTALNGHWEPGPGEAFLAAVQQRIPQLPFIAEDLGEITPDVIALRKAFALPGMHVLQFGFDEDLPKSPHALHNHEQNGVSYTGTHDNTTSRHWWESDGGARKSRFRRYTGLAPAAGGIAEALIRLACMSPARFALFPMQDILNLSASGRMNVPSRARGNWAWRMRSKDVSGQITEKMRQLVTLYGRLP
ncbi:4-alpha-glucanotransferase [Desulfobaculum bizertense]|uniref:4-alpha-glucanotransferase n=1 Tax=Desulfobaculum bizertense DSM 18034 TaxID=1121442 RepID=A0A1T4VES6_9BACT|nr:4-alpha-glucanotransferase [Desulfobaculum bizertense]SKA63383.1 4-alpha-glucanotransferase [Desulfobaculum bizertense DSM 18034]